VSSPDGHWAAFNAQQGNRPVRPLLDDLIRQAGPGRGRLAIDLGCGAGVETRALLDAGWRVHAVDGEPGTRERLLRTIGGIHRRLTTDARPFAALTELPPAHLVYAGYSLPYQEPDDFHRVWTVVRAALLPGGWLAANVFGEHDSWAGRDGMTFLGAADARALVDGLEVVSWYEEDEDGPAFSGPKHWHVFDLVARRPVGRQG
jgi:trans-aconitate methyltransferase